MNSKVTQVDVFIEQNGSILYSSIMIIQLDFIKVLLPIPCSFKIVIDSNKRLDKIIENLIL